MKTILIGILFSLIFFSLGTAQANICGTDYQNFNPTTSGLDFVTVHSSETLNPCILNMGLFFNYAANTLTYSRTINANVVAGEQPEDKILAADFSIGLGLTDNWDIGLSFPMVLSQELESPFYVSSFEKTGITEIKLNTKYRFVGDDEGGFAGVFSINNNLIENNPFAGEDSGPTFNFELAADKLFNKWAVGANVGYRKRNPGNAIAGQPFVPLEDQYIYSVATSYLLSSIDTKMIFELIGSRAVKDTAQDTQRSLNSTEMIAGFKTDLSSNVALHFGGGTEVFDSIGSPDWRVYTGINWAIGPFCEPTKSPVEKVRLAPPPPREEFVDAVDLPLPDVDDFNYPVERFEGKLPEIYRFPAEVLFEFDSDRVKRLYIPDVENVIRELKTGGFKRLVIEGHTDSVGSVAYNQSLSQRRAASVRQMLIDKYFVLPERVTSKGYGESRPIADNGNYQGRRQNRRVEFKIWR